VTNGAFRISSVGQDGITLDRAEKYWGRETVELERVRFVPIENAEKALAAYRAGEIDAVTNANFEPLALKLLTPFEDFQRVAYGALNFYEFNLNKPPFNDRRVREALAISIERKRLTEDEMDGASLPALSFLPFEKANSKKLVEDIEKAKNLLAESGFPEGENFPPVKLLVNRNNIQQRIARSVAKMWKQNLNVETEIVLEDTPRLAEAWSKNEFDLLRRGVTLPTVNETINMMAIFAPHNETPNVPVQSNSPLSANNSQTNGNSNTNLPVLPDEKVVTDAESARVTTQGDQVNVENHEENAILTEEQALADLPGIPLYFPTSYSLVKPYIQGFEINILDAPSLKNVKIDNNWQPKAVKKES
jgi:oligopeptide transport system substrate-binding protein